VARGKAVGEAGSFPHRLIKIPFNVYQPKGEAPVLAADAVSELYAVRQ
jgi:hypothetical protein